MKEEKKKAWQLPPISLDVSIVERQFSEAEEAKRMIVHEQLRAMERFDSKPLMSDALYLHLYHAETMAKLHSKDLDHSKCRGTFGRI